jgi:hypothetical protein
MDAVQAATLSPVIRVAERPVAPPVKVEPSSEAVRVIAMQDSKNAAQEQQAAKIFAERSSKPATAVSTSTARIETVPSPLTRMSKVRNCCGKSLNDEVSSLTKKLPTLDHFKSFLSNIHDILVTADVNIRSQLLRSIRLCLCQSEFCNAIIGNGFIVSQNQNFKGT